MSFDFTGAIGVIGGSADAVTSLLRFVKSVRGNKGVDAQAVVAAQEQVLQLQQALFSAQQALFSARDINLKLQEENRKLKQRDLQLENYKLVPVGTGPAAFVYIDKKPVEGAEQSPYYCQPCLEDGNRAVLQFTKSEIGFDTFSCPRCQAGVRVSNRKTAAGVSVERTGRSRFHRDMDGF